MLTSLVPGVGMGGTPVGGIPPGSGGRFMILLGAGRAFIPFVIGAEVFRMIMSKIFEITHLSNLG